MNGARVGITAARRADQQAALVRALGGVPWHGPSVDIDAPAPDAVLLEILRAALAAPLDAAVFVTGVGAGHLLGAAAREGLLEPIRDALRSARVIARGSKPRSVLREFGMPIHHTATPAESRVIRDLLLSDSLTGRRILVQSAGSEPDPMIPPLLAAGADVVEAHPYEIDVPPDGRPAIAMARAAASGALEALTFTSAHAVHGFVALAERAGVDTASIGDRGTLIVAVGPITRRALLDHGMPVHVEPRTPRMGAMLRDLAAALSPVRRPGPSGSVPSR